MFYYITKKNYNPKFSGISQTDQHSKPIAPAYLT